jgi:uncharacterized DUF497 family protein
MSRATRNAAPRRRPAAATSAGPRHPPGTPDGLATLTSPNANAWYFSTVTTIEHDEFEWDDTKAIANEKKHGVTFTEAATVFDDVDLLVNADPQDPSRFIAVGFSAVARVLVVVHAAQGERIRLISARRATVREEHLYAQRRER